MLTYMNKKVKGHKLYQDKRFSAAYDKLVKDDPFIRLKDFEIDTKGKFNHFSNGS